MASPLNTFKTVTKIVTSSEETVYTAPSSITAIVLLAQATNISNSDGEITFSYFNVVETSTTELVKNFAIPTNDAASLLTGKLVIENNNSVTCFASANNTFKLTLSILESLNA